MFDLFLRQLPQFLTWDTALIWSRAMLMTLAMAGLGSVIGFALAFVLVYLRTWPSALLLPLRVLIIAYVEVFRRIPFLVLVFLVLFATRAMGLRLSLFSVACLTVTLVATAYLAEIVRAGVESIHRSQWEAAETMNFSRLRATIHVIVPQAWPVIVPPAFSYFVMFIKETSLTSQIGAFELMSAGKYFNNAGYSAILAFGTCLMLYFALSFPLTLIGHGLEERLKRRLARLPARDLQAETRVVVAG